jgi:hypothetical protein
MCPVMLPQLVLGFVAKLSERCLAACRVLNTLRERTRIALETFGWGCDYQLSARATVPGRPVVCWVMPI